MWLPAWLRRWLRERRELRGIQIEERLIHAMEEHGRRLIVLEWKERSRRADADDAGERWQGA